MKEQVKHLHGLVLAGGQSSRMDSDKSQLEFHGIPQLDYAFQLLLSFCEQVYTSVSTKARLSEYKNPIRDQFSFGGPIDGILSALELKPDVTWVTLPVDMPLVDQATISLLIQNRDKTKMATCFRHKGDGNLEPLLTIWEPQCRKPLLDFCQKGESSPHQFLKTADVLYVDVADEKPFLSINSSADLAILQQHLANRNKK